MRVIIRTAYERRVEEEWKYLLGYGAVAAAQKLLDQAYDFLPNPLAMFPRIGRDFLVRNPETPEVLAAWGKARELVGDDIELREYILGDYLALYAIHGAALHLMTLRHHRQSGFDFDGA